MCPLPLFFLAPGKSSHLGSGWRSVVCPASMPPCQSWMTGVYIWYASEGYLKVEDERERRVNAEINVQNIVHPETILFRGYKDRS